MSWITTLYETYENIIKQGSKDLLPIAHSTQNAHIEVTLNSNSEMELAKLVAKDDAETLIPVTESSASRGNGSIPHPLCDKLQYLAGDYEEFGGTKGTKFHEDYIKQLKAWVESDYSNNKIKIIYNYLIQGNIISDLVRFNILHVDENNNLVDKFKTENMKISVGNQIDAFIRFRVVTLEDDRDAVWQDENLINDYTNYYLSKQENKSFCYAKGEIIPCSNNHPSKIRNSNDKAKLISSNDTSNYTFKGRFLTAEQATKLSYEVSQKAHNALKWLVSNQGQRTGDKIFVLWGTENQNTPELLSDTQGVVDIFLTDLPSENEDITKKDLAEQFNKAITGYKAKIHPNAKLALIGIGTAARGKPSYRGRLSIIFYREYNGIEGHELIDNIKNWHEKTAWSHRYKFKDKKIPFNGAPSLQDIATVTYGTERSEEIEADSRIASNVVERLLPCIIDGRKIPKDIALKLIEKAKRPQNYTKIDNWYKVLTIACSVYRKYLYDYKKEEYTMEIKETSNLAYNCGRLLAIADAIEGWVLREKSNGDDIRQTNAMRYFTKYTRYPSATWALISKKVMLYREKLGERKGKHLYKLLGEISSMIDPDEFKNASNLDGCMVLGFDTQRQVLINKAIENKKNKGDN